MIELPAIIDIEASGLGRGSYPIEIGFVTASGDVGCTLIKPVSNWNHWDASAASLHGISQSILLEHGKAVDDVALWLNEVLKGNVVYSDGWGNDMSWLGKLYEEASQPQLFQIKSILDLLTEEEREVWSTVLDKVVGEAGLTRHRASSDARLIQETYRRIKCL